jgi:hypothetical protein
MTVGTVDEDASCARAAAAMQKSAMSAVTARFAKSIMENLGSNDASEESCSPG